MKILQTGIKSLHGCLDRSDAMDRNFLLGILMGTAVGAAVTLLYTPSRGSEVRVQIADKSRQAAGAIGKAASAVRGRVGEYEDQLRHAI